MGSLPCFLPEIMRDGKIAKYSVVPAFISPEEFQKQYASKN